MIATPTLQELVKAEDDRIREAIAHCRKINVPENALVGAVMVLLKGKANPTRVYRLIQEQS